MTSSIDERRGVFGIEPISRLLPIAPSSYCENVAKRTDADRLSICVRSDISLKNRGPSHTVQVFGPNMLCAPE